VQDKVWVTGPGQEPWEVYVVKGDADVFGASETLTASGEACCGTTDCCTPAELSLDPDRTAAEAKAASGCACG
jgi:hypothetical protein